MEWRLKCQWRNKGFVLRDVKSSRNLLWDLKIVTFSNLSMSLILRRRMFGKQTKITWPKHWWIYLLEKNTNHSRLTSPIIPAFWMFESFKGNWKTLKEKNACHFEIKFLSGFLFHNPFLYNLCLFLFCFVETRWSKSLQFLFQNPPTHRLCVSSCYQSMKTKKE